ncbi:hypothetical protein C9J44_19900 [Photobacterium sp. GB-27]|nr:hypothetical protein C9J44_19900 [Photobacterium sp. GB-27]PSV54768.1 hypothetical protein C9J45_04240 [Photobacterium sp. GB-1]
MLVKILTNKNTLRYAMAKRKMIALRALQVSYHPLLARITEDDHFQLTNQAQLSNLSNVEVTHLLE